MTASRRVFVLCDLAEEGWPSMDLAAEAIVESIAEHGDGSIAPVSIRPAMVRRFTRTTSRPSARFNADRALNRGWDYPRYVRGIGSRSDVYHVVDHSYAQLVHELPASRTVVTCHDLDTFRCVTHPADEPRSWLFRLMTSRTLAGLRKAARICCVSEATKAELAASQLVDADRLRVIPNPVHPVFTPCPQGQSDARADALLGNGDSIDILHVGSTIARKRIDLLLRVVAALREPVPAVRLIRVGGRFTEEQQRMVDALRLGAHVLVLPDLDRQEVAAVYRRAALTLLTSEREGFGLPLLESVASGTPVLASDIPVFREVGGGAAAYAPIGGVRAWVDAVAALLGEREMDPVGWAGRRERGLRRARQFSWPLYAQRMTGLYSELL